MEENSHEINDLEFSGLLSENIQNLKSRLLDRSPEDIAKYLNEISNADDLKIVSALKDIIINALPTILFYFSIYYEQGVNLIFISHTSDKAIKNELLNAMGVSHLYVNRLLLSVSTGLVSVFGSLGANAYSDKNYYLMRLYAHRTQIVGFSFTIILIIFNYFFAVKIISFIGVQNDVLLYVDEYIKMMMIYVIFEVQYLLNMQYLNIIKSYYMHYIIFLSTLVFHPFFCYIFIMKLKLGVRGAAISLILSQMLNAVEGMIYIYVLKPLPESIFFFNRDSFKGLWNYLKVAIPTTIMFCAEWVSFELVAIVAIWISKPDFTVHVLMVNYSFFSWSIYYGLGVTATIIMGKAICDRGVKTVKKYINIFSIFSIVIMVICDIFILITHKFVLRLYVDDEYLLAKEEQIIPLLYFINIFFVLNYIFGSICRGLGKEFLASTISFISYYGILILLAILFGKWLNWGVFGIWVGIMLTELLGGSTYSFLLFYYFDYEKIQLNVLKKLHNDTELLSDDTNET